MYVCVSFDIKSLFTNVPLKDVLEDIVKTVFPDAAPPLLFNNNQPETMDDKKKSASKRITKTVFKNMLNVCSESIFLY